MNLRNDFSVWGVRQGAGDAEIPIHMRYAIDKKPTYYRAYDGMIYTTNEHLIDDMITKLKELDKKNEENNARDIRKILVKYIA